MNKRQKQPQDKAVSRLTFRLHLTKSQKWKRKFSDTMVVPGAAQHLPPCDQRFDKIYA
jgi:hypothetical protein